MVSSTPPQSNQQPNSGNPESSRRYEVSFKCRTCQGAAKMLKVDGGLERVDCSTCGISTAGVDAVLMYETLFLRFRTQVAHNVVRRTINKGGVFKAPPSQVSNEFADPRWPFILKVNLQN